jgi:hypothetical protein
MALTRSRPVDPAWWSTGHPSSAVGFTCRECVIITATNLAALERSIETPFTLHLDAQEMLGCEVLTDTVCTGPVWSVVTSLEPTAERR